MKKLSKSIITILLLCLALCVLFCSCKKNDTGDDGTTDTSDVPETESSDTNEDVVLFENGAYVYRLVRSDSGIENGNKETVRIKNALKDATGVNIDITTDFEDKGKNTEIKEILVGRTNRVASTDAYVKLLGNEGIVRVVDNKLLILGGSPDALTLAVDFFISEFLDASAGLKSTITIPADYDHTVKLPEEKKNVAIIKTTETASYFESLVAAMKDIHPADKVNVKALTDDLTDTFSVDKTWLVVISDANVITGQARSLLDKYISAGGRALLLGGPAFENVSYNVDGELVDLPTYLKSEYDKVAEESKQMVFDIEKLSALSLTKQDGENNDIYDYFVQTRQNVSQARETYAFGDFGLSEAMNNAEIADQIKMSIVGHNPISYSYHMFTYNAPVATEIKSKVDAISFWARSDETDTTEAVILEILDSNGALWSKQITLTSEWQFFVVDDKDFSVHSRGATTVAKNPAINGTTKILFGLDNTIHRADSSNHTFYLGQVEYLDYDSDALVNTRDIDMWSVAPYELAQYPVTNGEKVKTFYNQGIVSDREYVCPAESVSTAEGVQATGYNKNRPFRQIPLLEVTHGENDDRSGYMAWINLNSNGSAVGYFGACSDEFYNENGILAVKEAAQALLRRGILYEGGTDEYTYVKSDTDSILLGASYLDISKYGDVNAVIKVSLYKDGGETLLKEFSSENDLKEKGSHGADIRRTFEATYDLSQGEPDYVITTMSVDGVVIDVIKHEVDIWEPKPVEERNYFYAEDGYFMRDGEIVTLAGVNFEPYICLSMKRSENWYARDVFDPDQIRLELERVVETGFNAVAVFLYATEAKTADNNMLYFLNMCEEMGLYVDMAIRSRTDYALEYLFFSKEDADNLVVGTHFFEHDNIIAFDMCWERRAGNYEGTDGFGVGRKRWNSDWAEWIVSQYGSVENAEKVWGSKVWRDENGEPRGPNDSEMDAGSAVSMLNAFYRFMDDKVAWEFNEFKQYYRTLDPNHLISFRMQNAGSNIAPSVSNYDFQSLASYADVMEPEGYNLGTVQLNDNDDNAMREQIYFVAAYARYAAPNTPVVMKEWGTDSDPTEEYNFNEELFVKYDGGYEEALADGDTTIPVHAALEADRALKYMYEAEYAGWYFWWSCTGYRASEKNYGGIMNFDGSDYYLTDVFRKWNEVYKQCEPRREQNEDNYVYIEVERDDFGYSLRGMYRDEYTMSEMRRAWAEGKNIEFINHTQTVPNEEIFAHETIGYATDGRDNAGGQYPLRYVNGQIKKVEITIENNMRYATLVICNTGHTTWKAGTVALISTGNSEVKITDTTFDTDVKYLEDIEVKVLLKRRGNIELRFELSDPTGQKPSVEFGMPYKNTIT